MLISYFHKNQNPVFLYKVLGLLEQEDAFHDGFHSGRFSVPYGLHLDTEAGWITSSSAPVRDNASQSQPLLSCRCLILNQHLEHFFICSLETNPEKQLLKRTVGSAVS